MEVEVLMRMVRDGGVTVLIGKGEITFGDPGVLETQIPPELGSHFVIRAQERCPPPIPVQTGKKKAEWKSRNPWPKR